MRSGFEGVPDNAMEWVEDWDKFDDEGACTCGFFCALCMVMSARLVLWFYLIWV